MSYEPTCLCLRVQNTVKDEWLQNCAKSPDFFLFFSRPGMKHTITRQWKKREESEQSK